MPGIKTIAITRPLEDAQKLADELQAKGYSTYIAPMLDIVPITQSAAELRKAILQSPQLICVTSKHAVRMLAQQEEGRDIALCAVGEVTAREATQAGFANVADAGGNAQALLEYILKNCDPASGPLLYARGVDVSTDLATQLHDKGFTVKEVITYKAEYTHSLPEHYVDALKAHEVDAVMFFSRRSAENYVRLIHEQKLQQCHEACVAIGDKHLAEVLAALPFRHLQPFF